MRTYQCFLLVLNLRFEDTVIKPCAAAEILKLTTAMDCVLHLFRGQSVFLLQLYDPGLSQEAVHNPTTRDGHNEATSAMRWNLHSSGSVRILRSDLALQ